MLQKIATLGVKRTLVLAIAAALLIAGTLTAVLVNREVRKALEHAMLHRGESDARVYAAELAAALAEKRDERVAAEVEGGWDEQSFAYVIVLRADWTIAAKRLARDWRGSAEEAISAHTTAGLARPEWRTSTPCARRMIAPPQTRKTEASRCVEAIDELDGGVGTACIDTGS